MEREPGYLYSNLEKRVGAAKARNIIGCIERFSAQERTKRADMSAK